MNPYNMQASGEQGFEEDALRAVMAIELEAQTIIRNAELEAQQIIESAKEQAQELRTAEIGKWKQEHEHKLDQYRHEVDTEVQAIRIQAQALAQQWTRKATMNMQRAVGFALQAIILRNSVD